MSDEDAQAVMARLKQNPDEVYITPSGKGLVKYLADGKFMTISGPDFGSMSDEEVNRIVHAHLRKIAQENN